VSRKSHRPNIEDLVGPRNETILNIEGTEVQTLIDNGSQVSTISEEFHQTYLKHIPIQPLEDILEVETAGDHPLPYSGFIEVQLKAPEMKSTYIALVLVVPTTSYHMDTPLLIGMNIIRKFLALWQEESGKINLPTAWEVAKRCVTVQDQNLRRTNGDIGVVKSCSRKTISLQSNQTITVTGVAKTVYCQRQTVMLHPTEKSVIPNGVEICPAVVHAKNASEVKVTMSNLSLETVVIPPSAVLCQLKIVDVEEMPVESKREPENPVPLSIDLESAEEELSTEEFLKFKDTLDQWETVFAKDDMDLGHTDVVKHRIKLENPEPFKQRCRRIPPAMIDELKEHLHQMADLGVIRESHSPFASNIVPVRKKNGKLRFCIDYRQLNKRTVKDAYAIPRIEDTLDLLHGKRWFSAIDLKAGYWQVDMEESDKPCTAFTVGPLGHWECNRLPFGLTNSPATFQRMMEQILGDLNMRICIVYLDDIVIFSDSVEEHLHHLELVFERIRQYGLKLNPEKCQFFQKKIKYLGHLISAEGIEADEEKTKVLETWPVPTNVDEVRKYLGFVGYFRKYVKDYAKIAKPLNDLLAGHGKPSNRRNGKKPKKTSTWKWEREHQEAFEILIDRLASPPILAYPDFKGSEFLIHTDASGRGLGAVLYQNQDGHDRVIAYASRGLRASERNYPAHKLEFLALKWAVTDRFKDLLYGNTFQVVTDNNPLTYVLTSAKLDATGQRWIATLAEYDFSIKYRPGKQNQDADALSRLNHEECCISSEAIKAIGKSYDVPNVVEAVSMSVTVVDQLPEAESGLDTQNYQYWRKVQREDPIIHTVMRIISDEGYNRRQDESKEVQTLLRERKKLTLKRGVLYRKKEDNEEEIHQLVLPMKYRDRVLSGLHDDMGHQGVDRTLSLIRDRFYWPNMTKDVSQHVSSCTRCILRKGSAEKAPLVNIVTKQPLELVCVDYLTIEPSKGGIENVLVVTDHFTRYAQAYPTANQTAKTTAKILFDNFIVHYGFPLRLHSDQGRNFESQVIQELCKMANIDKSHTTPYHAMGNGMTERFNRTLLGMLGTCTDDKKKDWKSYLAPMVHAYNSTRHESTGYSPFYLMFGRQPRLPIDVAMGLPEDAEGTETYSEFISSLKKRLEYTYKLATRAADEARDKQKKYYDKHRSITTNKLDVGDRVLVKQTAFQGKHKLANKWENSPYVIVKQPNADIPVFLVRKEDGTGEKLLHRNLLLPIGALPIQCDEPKKTEKKSGSRERKEISVVEPTSQRPEEGNDSDETDEEEYEAEEEQPEEEQAEEEQPEEEQAEEEQPEEEQAEEEQPEEEQTEEEQPEEDDEEVLRDQGIEEETLEEVEEVLRTEGVEEEEEKGDEVKGQKGVPRPAPRRSQREKRPPERYRDYILQQHSTVSNTDTHAHALPTPSIRHKHTLSHTNPIPLPRQSKEVMFTQMLGIQQEMLSLLKQL